jgi:Sugar-transfer associated ATP-grasp
MLNFLSIHGIRNRFRLILNDNNWKGVLDNKWFFHLHFRQFGFPVPETYDDIAAKLDTPPDVHYRMRSYQLDLPGYVLQARLKQHAFLDAIAPYTTNTIRVVTFLDADNEVHVHFSIVRVGRKGSMADNWDRGGISIAVDPASGVLGRGVLKPKYRAQRVESHPDTGVCFVGLQMPFWNEVLDLCSRAARLTPNLRSVGWDIAVTPDGPVIIEGNPDWDLPGICPWCRCCSPTCADNSPASESRSRRVRCRRSASAVVDMAHRLEESRGCPPRIRKVRPDQSRQLMLDDHPARSMLTPDAG